MYFFLFSTFLTFSVSILGGSLLIQIGETFSSPFEGAKEGFVYAMEREEE